MVLDLVLIIIGLIICFGGIHFRRLFSGIIGFIWGSLLSVFFFLVVMEVRRYDLQDYLVAIIVIGLALGIVSAVYYRVCALINGFITGFFVAFLIAALINDFDTTAGVIIIALILGLLSAVLSFKFYDYSFIILTAFLGALIASIGLYGVITGSEVDEIIVSLAWSGSEGIAIVFAITLVLTIIGFIIQLKKLRIVGAATPRADGKSGSQGYRYNGPSGASRFFSRVGSLLADVLQFIISSIADVFSGFRTSESRSSLKEELFEARGLLFAPVFSFIVVPAIYALLSKTYYSTGWFTVASWLEIISLSISLAVFVFCISDRSKSFTLLFVALSVTSYLIFNFSSLSYFSRYTSTWYVIIMALRFLICWIVVSLISKILSTRKAKYIVLNIAVFLLNEFLIDLIAGSYRQVRLNSFFVAKIIVQAVAAVLIYKFHRMPVNSSSGSDCKSDRASQPKAIWKEPTILLSVVLVLVLSAYAIEPLFIKGDKHRYEQSVVDSYSLPSNQEQQSAENHSAPTSQGQQENGASQATVPALSALRDGTYNVILYKNSYESRDEGTYATVDIEEYVRYSDIYVDSLRIGSVVEGTVVESLEPFEYEYGSEIWINDGNLRLFKSSSASDWMLLWPSDVPVSHIVKDIVVLFPSNALYYDEMTAVIEDGEFEPRELNRIEDFFENNPWANDIEVSITVTNSEIVEAYIYYTP